MIYLQGVKYCNTEDGDDESGGNGIPDPPPEGGN